MELQINSFYICDQIINTKQSQINFMTTTTKGTTVAKAHAPKASKVNLADALDSVDTDTAVAEKEEHPSNKLGRTVKGVEAEKFNTTFQHLPLESIEVEKGFNARKDFGDMEALQESISQAGLTTPLTVRGKNGKWILVKGHRRLKALQAIVASGDWKFDAIGCYIEDNTVSETERTIDLLIDNDGKPLTMVEQADVFERLEKAGYSPVKIAAHACKTTQHIRDCKLLATATPRTMQMLADGKIAATNIISIIRKEGDPKKAEVKVMELVAGTSATGKVSGKAVKAATRKDKKTAEGSSIRDRLNSIYERVAVNEKELKYSEYDLITVMQWMETGQGDIEAILKGKNQKGAK